MRVIAGEARGRRLSAPPGTDIRPTSDRVRESLFNILAQYIDGAHFLDLFAGTGANGIEALSRGATTVTFVDDSPIAMNCIRENLIHTKLNLRASMLRLRLPDDLPKITGSFDIIFADPPYAFTAYEQLLQGFSRPGMLYEGARVVIEHRKTVALPAESGPLKLDKQRHYGDTTLSIYR